MIRPSTRRWGRAVCHVVLAAVMLAAVMLAATACGTPRRDASAVAGGDGAPGRLLAAPADFRGYPVLQEMVQTSVRILYRSTSGVDGSRTAVSGTVFVPNGRPPAGGWPIAAIGHPTSGLNSPCAPSAYPGLMGNLTSIIPFLELGLVGVLPDYQGLGTPGRHPYLDSTTEAYNVIDAVRAAREVVSAASDAWISYGVSQGGQAVWAANELAADYGRGLRLEGSISIAAPTDLRPLVDEMVAGTLTTPQKVLLPMLLRGLQVLHPELRLADYLHGTMLSRIDVFLSCAGEQEGLKSMVADAAPPSETTPIDAAAADRLRGWLGRSALPQRPASAPMLVAYGDADQVVLPAWTREGVRRACAIGDVIDLQVAPGQGHGMLDLGTTPVTWVKDRLAGVPAPNTCPQP
jgi:pimeloyl-ACP methyl ester carboxylesterase